MRQPALIVGMAALAAILFWPRRASASMIDNVPADEDAPEYPEPVTEGYSIPLDFDYGIINWLENGTQIMAGTADDNLRGFLYMLRNCEHRESDVSTGSDYGTFFGGSRFYNFADHPVITGEKTGVPLKPEWCRRAGFASGVCVSTAAGAYQFTRPTWERLRAAGRYGPRLPDFSPASQDEAARRLLASLGALPMIELGQIEAAISVASRAWASLPGSSSGQPQKPLTYAIAKFNEGAAA